VEHVIGSAPALAPRVPAWGSLSQERAVARGPAEIAAALGAPSMESGLERVAEAMRAAFPDNLLGDLDHWAWAVAREAADGDDPDAHVGRATETTVELMRLFGCATPIRFRYVHDFVYGFDWAKWVRKDPAARAAVGPFDLAFLERMVRRGHELLALIAEDDEKYPQLRDDRPRNPFGFSREPEDELRLFRDLAARGLLPVEAWRLETAPTWDRPFTDLRAERARVLGLG